MKKNSTKQINKKSAETDPVIPIVEEENEEDLIGGALPIKPIEDDDIPVPEHVSGAPDEDEEEQYKDDDEEDEESYNPLDDYEESDRGF